MELRELKKEVEKIPKVEDNLRSFRESWLRPFTKNQARRPFFQDISPERRKELNQKLVRVEKDLQSLALGQIIQQKLQNYARLLIELKLTFFNDDWQKSRLITNQLLHDEFFNIKRTLDEVQSFERISQTVWEQYREINEFLEKNLPLEENLRFHELPHRFHLQNLRLAAEKQKALLLQVGDSFVTLTRQITLQKNV